jgi:hypothetical protein
MCTKKAVQNKRHGEDYFHHQVSCFHILKNLQNFLFDNKHCSKYKKGRSIMQPNVLGVPAHKCAGGLYFMGCPVLHKVDNSD